MRVSGRRRDLLQNVVHITSATPHQQRDRPEMVRVGGHVGVIVRASQQLHHFGAVGEGDARRIGGV